MRRADETVSLGDDEQHHRISSLCTQVVKPAAQEAMGDVGILLGLGDGVGAHAEHIERTGHDEGLLRRRVARLAAQVPAREAGKAPA